jgi:hypothetical protein
MTSTYPFNHNDDPRRTNGLFVLSVLCFVVYGVMLFAMLDVTFHSVDSVRDVALARAIADGSAFPAVSQPWAAKYQTPPGYLYVLSLPFFFGGDERAAFFFVAALCFASVVWLWRTLWGRIDPVVATVYVTTALVFPTSMFFHSAGNPSLAFAASSVALACVIRIATGTGASTRAASLPLVVMLALLPQLHLSSLPLVIATSTWLLWRIKTRMTLLAVIVGCVMVAASLVWLARYGYHASEYHDVGDAAATKASELASRVFDWRQWYTMATTYANYAKSVFGAPSWLSLCATIIAIYVVVAMCFALIAEMGRRDIGNVAQVPSVVWVTAITVLASVTYLEAWGVWYFDPLLPWVSVSAAIGVAACLRFLNRTRTRTGGEAGTLVFIAVMACVNLAPQLWLHSKLARKGYIEIEPSGLFASRHRAPEADAIPVLSARVQLAYRDRLAARSSCLGDVVGVAEWFLRDMTLRDGYARCERKLGVVDKPLERLLLKGFVAADDSEKIEASNPLSLHTLPPQRVRINGELRNSLYGEKLIRYGLYAPLEHATPPVVTIELRDKVPQIVRVALRCFDVKHANALQWRVENAETKSMRIMVDRAMLAMRYMEFEFVLSPSGETAMRILPLNAVHCDISAYVL